MTTLSATYESGTNGSALSTGDAGSPDAFDGVAVGSPNTLTYDAVSLCGVGSLSAKHVHTTTASSAYWNWTTKLGTQTQFYVRGYFKYTAPASTTIQQLFWGLSSGTIGWQIQLEAGTGGADIKLYAGLNTFAVSSTQLSAGTAFRLEAFIDHTNNAVTCKLFVGANINGTTADETFSMTGHTLGATSTNDLRIGTGSSSVVALTMWSDAVGMSTTGYLGPFVTTTTYSKTGGGVSLSIANGFKISSSLQYQRPGSDVNTSGWTPTPGSPTTLYDKVNETIPDDSTYVSGTAA